MPPARPRKRKKLSIFTSSTMPYGPSRNARIAGTDIEPTAYRNKASSRYFRLRKPTSSLRGRRKLRPKVWRPSRHRYSEAVPTGHSQPQKLLRKIQEAARKAISRNIPAGCSRRIFPLFRNPFRFLRGALGSQPSTPEALVRHIL